MSKALTYYLNNIKDKSLKISEESIVVTIDNAPKTVNRINIIKKPHQCREIIDFKGKIYKVIVKAYMTRNDSVNFTFHTVWNKNNPMPLRVMYGKVVDETKNMFKMNLHGKITKTDCCLRCGKMLTHEISKLYGLGPECGQHFYANPASDENFETYLTNLDKKLNEVTWEGWIPKVSIISMEEIDESTYKV